MAIWLADVPTRPVLDADDWSSFTGGPNKIVNHCTEGYGRPAYREFTWPHMDAEWVGAGKGWRGTGLDVVQYLPLDVPAYSLVNQAGGVQTNRDGARCIEWIGTCSPALARKGAFFWPGVADEVLHAVGTLLRAIASATSTSTVVAPDWASLDDNGYATRSVRFSLATWDNFGGICGHEHVPENDHVDPGNMNVPRAIALTGNLPPYVPPAPAPTPKPTVAPPFPLPAGDWFGPPSSNPHNHSGYYSATDRQKFKVWQARMAWRGWTITVDGVFGPQTERVCQQFQSQKGLGVDGLVGPRTWAAAWTTPVT